MSRQSTDQLYIDLTYYQPEEYLVYIAEAKVDSGFYIDNGYIDPDYYEGQGSFAELTCELTLVVGELKEFDADINTAFSTALTADKILGVSANFSSTFSIPLAMLSDISGVDIFAFAEAAIAIQIEVTRTTNILLTSVFDIATDGRRFRDITSDDQAVFSIDVVNQRSREFNLETQAAFSFAADNTRLKLYSSDLVSESALACTISHIEGADIVVSNFATLSATIDDRLRDQSAVLTTPSTLAFTGGLLVPAASDIRAHASIFTSRYVGSDRPKTISGTFDSDNLINSSSRTTDLTALPNADNWFFETQLQYQSTGELVGDTPTGVRFFSIPLGSTSSGGAVVLTGGWRYRRNEGVTFSISVSGGVSASGSLLIIDPSTVQQTPFVSFAASYTGGRRLALYIFGQRVALVTDWPNAGTWTIPNTVSAQFAPGFPFTTALGTQSVRTNYSWLTYGNLTNSGATSYTSPLNISTGLMQNTADTIFLYNFNGNGSETLGLTQTGQAAITSVSSVSATLSGTQTGTATLTATANLVSSASVDRGAEITVDNFATLSADVTHIKSLASDLDSEFSQQATVDYIFGSNADLTVDSQTIVDGQRLRGFTIFTDAVGVIVAVTAKVGAFFINAETETIFSVDANKTTDITTSLTVDSNTSILGKKFGSLEAGLDTESTVNASANRTRDTEVSLNTTADINIESSNTLDFLVDLASEFMLMADAKGGTIRATLVAESFANLTAQAQSTLSAQISLNSLFTVSADTEDSLTVRIVSDMFSNGSVTADNSRLRDNIIVTESVASNLMVVVKTTDADIALTSTLNLSAEANKTVGYTAELATDVSVSTLGSLTRTTSVELETQTAVSAIGRKDSESAADLFSSTTLSAIGVKGTEILLQAFTNAGLTLDANVIREVAVEESATTELTAEFDRTRSTAIQLLAFSAQLTVGGITADAVAIQLGTFTLSAQIGVLHLQEYVYIVPGETRYYKISSETRVKSIAGETRIYTIRR